MSSLTHDETKLTLKPIYELLGEAFYIPAYQRGYRWKSQVKDLLDDIWEFAGKDAPFYCLQPIVVTQRSSREWEVVDGQQRLTSLYIILHFLEKEHLRRDLQEAFNKPSFSLEYETRPDSANVLKDLSSAQKSNIDYHYIFEAYQTVASWFADKDYNDTQKFMDVLLAKSDGRPVQVIWYDLSEECKDNDYAIDVFARINIGKIALTNAELVKALFLRADNFDSEKAYLKQIQIASEWDTIEKSLQDDSFWYFLCSSGRAEKYDTHIEYIFDLMMQKPAEAEAHYTFHQFYQQFRKNKRTNGRPGIDALWKTVKDYFLTFESWYKDRELYHLIGFLVDCGASINELKAEADKLTKSAFIVHLKGRIRKQVKCRPSELSYGDGPIRKVLLLFNIQTLLSSKEADMRFPFNRYKKESWDIEHIRSQTDQEVSGSSRKTWALDVLEYLTGTRDVEKTSELESSRPNSEHIPFISRLREVLEPERIDTADFKALRTDLLEKYKEDNELEGVDSIANLTLLDSTTNRSYKNALFPVKRQKIIENEKTGVFVPICTKNVFLKFYSRELGDVMYWKEQDGNDYLKAIERTLREYLPDEEECSNG